MTFGQRFARFATDAVVARPQLWRLFRGPLRVQFDRLAPTWQQRVVGPQHLAALELALAETAPPRRALDLGTGTGAAAFAVARRFPEAEVVGVDLSPEMVAQAAARARRRSSQCASASSSPTRRRCRCRMPPASS